MCPESTPFAARPETGFPGKPSVMLRVPGPLGRGRSACIRLEHRFLSRDATAAARIPAARGTAHERLSQSSDCNAQSFCISNDSAIVSS